MGVSTLYLTNWCLLVEHEPDPKTGRDKYFIVEKTAADEEDIWRQ